MVAKKNTMCWFCRFHFAVCFSFIQLSETKIWDFVSYIFCIHNIKLLSSLLLLVCVDISDILANTNGEWQTRINIELVSFLFEVSTHTHTHTQWNGYKEFRLCLQSIRNKTKSPIDLCGICACARVRLS